MDTVSSRPPFDDLEDRILPWSQVKVICGLSRTTVWRMQKTGDFPLCVQVSRNRVGWWQSELLAWRRARTPRRQAEQRQIATVPDPEPQAIVRSIEAPLPVPVDEAPDLQAKSSRRKKSVSPDNQTAFDFGG